MRKVVVELFSIRELDEIVRMEVINWFVEEIKKTYENIEDGHKVISLLDNNDMILDAIDSLGYEFYKNGKLFREYKMIVVN